MLEGMVAVFMVPPISLQHTSNLQSATVLPSSQLPKANLD
jgi:hypothetical protein